MKQQVHDIKTEAEFINELNILNEKINSPFLIAHRLSTVKKCDCIYEFENGRIKEFGTYDELIQKSKSFRTMTNIKYNKNELAERDF